MGRYLRDGIWVSFLAVLGVCGLACRSKLDVKSNKAAKTSSKCELTLNAAPGEPCGAIEDPLPETPTSTQTDVASTDDGGDEVQPTDDGSDDGQPVPKEMADGFNMQGDQAYYQTRSTIVVRIKSELMGTDDSNKKIEILNVTKQDNPETPEVLTLFSEEMEGTAALRTGIFRKKRLAIAKHGEDYLVAFYPTNDNWKGLLYYGKNKLRVVVTSTTAVLFSEKEVTLQDFDVYGMAMTSFGDNRQVACTKDHCFQGWVNVVSPPTVYALEEGTTASALRAEGGSDRIKAVLTSGMFNIINPHGIDSL